MSRNAELAAAARRIETVPEVSDPLITTSTHREGQIGNGVPTPSPPSLVAVPLAAVYDDDVERVA